MQRIDVALKIHFALLAALGGIILGVGDAAGALPLIAVFSALFSLVFIDLLGLFALPSLAAYIGMGLVAAYCISDFVPLDPTNNRQLTAVAQLLVLVQAVLMLQKKTRRVFEQIGVFCLLELVVAAVFNNALIYAILLVPVSLLGLSALVLLQIATAAEPAIGKAPESTPDAGPLGLPWKRRKIDTTIRTAAPGSVASLTAGGSRLPAMTVLASAAPVLLVAGTFFYALPRTAESDSSSIGATPVVGFSERVELDQIGHLQQSDTPVMRVQLTDAETDEPYSVIGSLYLRGAVLDHYDLTQGSGRWQASSSIGGYLRDRMPKQFLPERSTDELFYDEVEVAVTLQPQSTENLFAIAPYHRVESPSKVSHAVGAWTLQRRQREAMLMYPRMNYRFGTHAFFNGSQTQFLRTFAEGEDWNPDRDNASWFRMQPSRLGQPVLLEFSPRRLPTIQSIADALVGEMPESARTPYNIARRLNRYLRFEADLDYTLDLTMTRDPSLDPLEQFVRSDRKGHCQYFASTLAMMLRSQGIPARLVVGYKSDEFSPYGQHYIIRQLHAHAWVEALLQEDELPEDELLYGQPSEGPLWMRLDPTPGAEVVASAERPALSHRLDYLQALWERYVLDMDAKQQNDTLLGAEAIGGEHGTYTRLFQWLRDRMESFDLEPWNRGSLIALPLFSLPAALLAVLGSLAAFTLYRVGLPRPSSLWRRHATSVDSPEAPKIPFFVQTCDQLKRVGLLRMPHQTAAEFTDSAAGRFHANVEQRDSSGRPQSSPLPAVSTALAVITDAYYRARFGGEDIRRLDGTNLRQALDSVQQAVEQQLGQGGGRRS